MFLQILANGLCAGSIYAIVALGFGLIYNSTNIFHFAHGAVYIISAYIFYYLMIILKITPIIAFTLSILISGLLGIIIDKFIYEPLSKKHISSFAFMISSFGIYLFAINFIALLFGNETKVFSTEIEKTYQIFDVILTRTQILSLISFILITILFFTFKRTNTGKLILAYSNNPKLLAVLGYNPNGIKSIIYGFGSILAGVAANLTALDVGIEPNIGMSAVLIGAASVIIGGVKVFEGALLGGILLGLIQSLVVWNFSAQWMDATTFLLLIIFLLFRPQGILGIKKRIEEEI